MARVISGILSSSVALLMACDGSTTPLGSCLGTGGTAPFCVDYESYPQGAAGVQAVCANFQFTYTEATCTKDMRVASCRQNSKNGAQLLYTYYVPTTVAEVQSICMSYNQNGSTAVFVP